MKLLFILLVLVYTTLVFGDENERKEPDNPPFFSFFEKFKEQMSGEMWLKGCFPSEKYCFANFTIRKSAYKDNPNAFDVFYRKHIPWVLEELHIPITIIQNLLKLGAIIILSPYMIVYGLHLHFTVPLDDVPNVVITTGLMFFLFGACVVTACFNAFRDKKESGKQ